MDDLKARRDKLLAEAADCDLIGNLAEDAAKRALFRRLAGQLRQMASEVGSELKSRAPDQHCGGQSCRA